jgi:hypothetical protein
MRKEPAPERREANEMGRPARTPEWTTGLRLGMPGATTVRTAVEGGSGSARVERTNRERKRKEEERTTLSQSGPDRTVVSVRVPLVRKPIWMEQLRFNFLTTEPLRSTFGKENGAALFLFGWRVR